MFQQATMLKDEVMDIICTFKSVKDDIASLKQSISHLSSIVNDNAKISIVKGISILQNSESKTNSDDDYGSLPISLEVSHHEIIIRRNIYKLKRDISRKIMNNQHLRRIVTHFPIAADQSLNDAFRLPSMYGDSPDSTYFNQSSSNKISTDHLGNHDILNHIESNINSIIPSYENTSMMTENKSSICFPKPQQYEIGMKSRNEKLQPDAMKRRLNSDIQK
jgi:hypothetical protein